MQILVIDDDESVARTVARVLDGHEVLVARDIASGLRELRRLRAGLSLVLVDRSDIGGDWLDAFRAARAAGVRAYAFSGHLPPEVLAAAREAGASGLVAKGDGLTAALHRIVADVEKNGTPDLAARLAVGGEVEALRYLVEHMERQGDATRKALEGNSAALRDVADTHRQLETRVARLEVAVTRSVAQRVVDVGVSALAGASKHRKGAWVIVGLTAAVALIVIVTVALIDVAKVGAMRDLIDADQPKSYRPATSRGVEVTDPREGQSSMDWGYRP